MIKSIRDRICANRDRCRGQASCWATNRPCLAEPAHQRWPTSVISEHRCEEWVSQARELPTHTHSPDLPGAWTDQRSSPRSGAGNRALDGHPPGQLCLEGVLEGSTGASANKRCLHEASWTCNLVLTPGGLQVPHPSVLGISEPSALYQSQMSGRVECGPVGGWLL